MVRTFRKRQPNFVNANSILAVLDQAAENFVFPMLDNGYVYLATSRLSLFRCDEHWAVVFEIFGFSPRAGQPDLSIITISTKLYARNNLDQYVSEGAYSNYLRNNPYWEIRSFFPISNDAWMDKDNPEFVAEQGEIILRDRSVDIPSPPMYPSKGIVLEGDKPAVFELCRYLAYDRSESMLATESERRVSIPPQMKQIMLLDEWHHPDLANGQTPSQTETFRQIAMVLERNDPGVYSALEPANNHWKNWPEGGTL